MKPIVITFFFSCLMLNVALAQNYQTFNSSDVNYFQDEDSDFIIATEIVSTEFIGEDSIFTPFKSLRDDDGTNLYLRYGWMGKKIIIRPDGTNLIINELDDTLFIETQAELGEEFVFYDKPDMLTINATVTSIVEESVLGTLDTVKTFLLSSDHPDFDLASITFRIGKNSGFIDVLRFYSFPHKYSDLIPTLGGETRKYNLVGSLFPKIGITKPTNYDIHNLEVGDVIQYEEYFDWEGYPESEESFRKTVLDKSITGTEVTYLIEINSRYFTPPTDGEEESYIYTIDTLSETYSISDEFYSGNLIPEKQYGSDFEDQFQLSYNTECGYKETKVNHGGERLNDSSIIYVYWHGAATTYSAIQGANDYCYSYSQFDMGLHYADGIYFSSRKNDFGICGNGEFLSQPNVELRNRPKLIYPNPASTRIFYDHHQSEFKGGIIRILNSQGQIVEELEIIENNIIYEVDISSLADGSYILKVFNRFGEPIETTRFIKHH